MATALALAEQRGRFLFELRPDIMPYDFLSDEEILLWDYYYSERQKRHPKKGG